jgi:hypothetical protein
MAVGVVAPEAKGLFKRGKKGKAGSKKAGKKAAQPKTSRSSRSGTLQTTDLDLWYGASTQHFSFHARKAQAPLPDP